MELNRRYFLKYIAGGAAGITLGFPFILESCSKQTGGNFPFYNHIKEYNFGDYIPKDQGGKFVQQEILGTENDEVVVEKIKGGILEKIYGDPIGWGSLEKTELEKSVWLNRFYYLPSFARQYYLKKDKNSLDFMMQFIRKWIAENPRNPEVKTSRYNWFDMQIAWRAIHLSWCYFLGEKGLSKEDKQFIINTLEEHGDLLLSGFGDQKLNEFNHQSHGALAMLYLGVLFPVLNNSQKLVDGAIRILRHHIKNAFYSDGGNVEQMFGYYPFEAHIFRDTYLLCHANNIPQPDGIKELLAKMSNYLLQVAQPDGTMPQINDSFPMPVSATLATLADILNNKEDQDPTSQFFPDSQITVMRNSGEVNDWYILANPASLIGAHSHAGRLGLTLWHNNQPILIDSGCCNYDNPLLVNWYRTSRAHNTVLIDGKSDEATSSTRQWAAKRQTENRITDLIEDSNYSYCRMESPESEATNSSVKWTRCIAVVKNMCTVIYDYFESPEKHDYEILFHLPPLQAEINQTKKSVLANSPSPMVFIPGNASMYTRLSMDNCYVSVDGKDTLAPVVSYHASGQNTHSAIIIAPVKNSESEIKIKQEVSDDGLGLLIETETGEKDIVIFRKSGAASACFWGNTTDELFSLF